MSSLYNSAHILHPDASMPYSKFGSFQGKLAMNSGKILYFYCFTVYPLVLVRKYKPYGRHSRNSCPVKVEFISHHCGALSWGYCPPSSILLDTPKFYQYYTIKLQTHYGEHSIKVDYKLKIS